MYACTSAGSELTRASAALISSCVRFLAWRKATFFSTGDEATLGSNRTKASVSQVGLSV